MIGSEDNKSLIKDVVLLQAVEESANAVIGLNHGTVL